MMIIISFTVNIVDTVTIFIIVIIVKSISILVVTIINYNYFNYNYLSQCHNYHDLHQYDHRYIHHYIILTDISSITIDVISTDITINSITYFHYCDYH